LIRKGETVSDDIVKDIFEEVDIKLEFKVQEEIEEFKESMFTTEERKNDEEKASSN